MMNFNAKEATRPLQLMPPDGDVSDGDDAADMDTDAETPQDGNAAGEAPAAAGAAGEPQPTGAKRNHHKPPPKLPNLVQPFTEGRAWIGPAAKASAAGRVDVVFHGPKDRIEDVLKVHPRGDSKYRLNKVLTVPEQLAAEEYSTLNGYDDADGTLRGRPR